MQIERELEDLKAQIIVLEAKANTGRLDLDRLQKVRTKVPVDVLLPAGTGSSSNGSKDRRTLVASSIASTFRRRLRGAGDALNAVPRYFAPSAPWFALLRG